MDDVAYLSFVSIVAKQRSNREIESAKHPKADERSLSWLYLILAVIVGEFIEGTNHASE